VTRYLLGAKPPPVRRRGRVQAVLATVLLLPLIAVAALAATAGAATALLWDLPVWAFRRTRTAFRDLPAGRGKG